jgi:GDP-D-mannose 3',5'-epimerase
VHIPGPTGVRGRNSDNHLIREKLGWAPSRPLIEGLEKTYAWIGQQVRGKEPKVAAEAPEAPMLARIDELRNAA